MAINKRDALKEVYRGGKWIQKVNEMTDEQVTAIYLRLKQQNKVRSSK